MLLWICLRSKLAVELWPILLLETGSHVYGQYSLGRGGWLIRPPERRETPPRFRREEIVRNLHIQFDSKHMTCPLTTQTNMQRP